MFEFIFEMIPRMVAHIIIEIAFELIFYYIGWPFMKILSLGKYPKAKGKYNWHKESVSDFFTSLLGVLITITFLVLFYFE